MKRILILYTFLTICLGTSVQAQECDVVLNHFYTVIDSTTYQAVLSSEIMNTNFAFSYEKIRNWGGGIYIIGEDNYIEIFHPGSINNECLPIGFTWVCQASLVANCTENYDLPENELITYSTDESFDELAVYTQDSSELFTTREMNEKLYESWTKKTFTDSLHFLTTDYNSPAEADSSKNYLFKNVTGIQVNLNSRDSLSVIQYLNLIGYTLEWKDQELLKFTNSKDFIELHFSTDVQVASIAVIYFELSESMESKRISAGSSEIFMDGKTGKWIINKLRETPHKTD